MGRTVLITIEEAATACKVEQELIEFLLQVELIPIVEQQGRRYIEDIWLEEIRRARRLLEDLEVNLPGIEIILRMRRQLLRLYQMLAEREADHRQQIEQLRAQYEERLRNLQQVIILEIPADRQSFMS